METKKMECGLFENLEDAIKARDNAENNIAFSDFRELLEFKGKRGMIVHSIIKVFYDKDNNILGFSRDLGLSKNPDMEEFFTTIKQGFNDACIKDIYKLNDLNMLYL